MSLANKPVNARPASLIETTEAINVFRPEQGETYREALIRVNSPACAPTKYSKEEDREHRAEALILWVDAIIKQLDQSTDGLEHGDGYGT